MNDSEYIEAVKMFTECRRELMQVAVVLDRATAERDPRRVGEANFCDIFVDRNIAETRLLGIAEISVKAATAIRKLDDADRRVLMLDMKPAPDLPTGVNLNGGELPPSPATDTSFIRDLKAKCQRFFK